MLFWALSVCGGLLSPSLRGCFVGLLLRYLLSTDCCAMDGELLVVVLVGVLDVPIAPICG